MRNRVSELPAKQSALDVSGRHELLWERELAYEVRALKVVTRCMQGRILCGDKSGRVSCFDFDNNNKKGWESRERAGGPIYDLTLLHPLSNGVDLLDPACHRCLIVAGAGNGDLVFLDYLSGQAVEVDCGGGPSHRYRFESSVL